MANIPTEYDLESTYKRIWNLKKFDIKLTFFQKNRPQILEDFVKGQCVLRYDIDIINTSNSNSIFTYPSSLLWYDNINHMHLKGRCAYLYLLEIIIDFRKKGIGENYVSTQHKVLPQYSISCVYLKAGHYGARFWSKMGYKFVNEEKFWMDYEEYCEYSSEKITQVSQIKDISTKYFDYLRESKLEYPMYYIF